MDIYEEAINRYGIQHQSIVAIEELSELIKEITKACRNLANQDHMAEEIADVIIMINQLIIMYGINREDIDLFIQYKIHRLEKMLGETE